MKNKENKNQDILVSSVVEKEKKPNSKIIIILSVIILILVCVIIFLIKSNDTDDDSLQCSSVSIKEVEVDPKYQLINFNGLRFKMPLDWNFVSNDSKYEIADEEEKLFIIFDTYNLGYEDFSTSEIQRFFLEQLQTSGDIKIDNSEEKENKYYLYEGSYNSYDYLIVAIGNKDKTVLVKTQFRDKISYSELKNKVIDFVLSAI